MSNDRLVGNLNDEFIGGDYNTSADAKRRKLEMAKQFGHAPRVRTEKTYDEMEPDERAEYDRKKAAEAAEAVSDSIAAAPVPAQTAAEDEDEGEGNEPPAPLGQRDEDDDPRDPTGTEKILGPASFLGMGQSGNFAE
jgi:hypothetical protein